MTTLEDARQAREANNTLRRLRRPRLHPQAEEASRLTAPNAPRNYSVFCANP
jgi:hypothetical protein